MMDFGETRENAQARYIRDSAVASAMATHRDHMREGIDERLVDQIAQLAVYTAMEQYRAAHASQFAAVESFFEMQQERHLLDVGRIRIMAEMPNELLRDLPMKPAGVD